MFADLRCCVRRFFPPTDQDLPKEIVVESKDEGELLARMPDPPTSEPLAEGQPEAKKRKVTSEDEEEGWEAVERPEGSSINGHYQGLGESMETDTQQEPTAMEQDKSKQETTVHAQEGGSIHPPNSLLADW